MMFLFNINIFLYLLFRLLPLLLFALPFLLDGSVYLFLHFFRCAVLHGILIFKTFFYVPFILEPFVKSLFT